VSYSDGDVVAGKASANLSLANVINAFLRALFFVILPRVLTAVELGTVAAVTLRFTVFQYLGQLGLNRSSPSLVSSALADGEPTAGRVV